MYFFKSWFHASSARYNKSDWKSVSTLNRCVVHPLMVYSLSSKQSEEGGGGGMIQPNKATPFFGSTDKADDYSNRKMRYQYLAHPAPSRFFRILIFVGNCLIIALVLIVLVLRRLQQGHERLAIVRLPDARGKDRQVDLFQRRSAVRWRRRLPRRWRREPTGLQFLYILLRYLRIIGFEVLYVQDYKWSNQPLHGRNTTKQKIYWGISQMIYCIVRFQIGECWLIFSYNLDPGVKQPTENRRNSSILISFYSTSSF